MGHLRQLGGGFLLGILSIGLVLGGFALAMAEGGLIPALVPTASPTFTQSNAYPTLELLSPLDSTPAASASPEQSPTNTNTLPPPPTTCLPPAGWIAISVQSYDTLDSIAKTYQTSVTLIQQANCLVSNELAAGSFLYVPPLPTVTLIQCGAPASWIIYTVQPGDTLYRIGLLYRISTIELQNANCLGGSTAIYTGQKLKVPNVVTSTATFTPVTPVTATATFVASSTATPSLVATEPTAETETPSPTNAPATETPEPSATPSPENTATPPIEQPSATP